MKIHLKTKRNLKTLILRENGNPGYLPSHLLLKSKSLLSEIETGFILYSMGGL